MTASKIITSPSFEKLKNPVLRKTVARVATLQKDSQIFSYIAR